MKNEPKKFTIDELLEDAYLSSDNCESEEDKKKWKAIIDFLLDYKHVENHSEFLWANQISEVDLEDEAEWEHSMKISDEHDD